MTEIKEKLKHMIDEESLGEVDRITGSVVKQAACQMKPNKGDVSGGYTSDTLLNAPDQLFEHLSLVFKSWIIHGDVTLTILACAFLPLLKNSLRNPSEFSSYRAIAGSSLILKLFDNVILLVWGHLLSSDSLQFGYKQGTSTTQCSWMTMEVANYFLRNGSKPIITLLDCTKAFDMCRYDKLFYKLMERKVPAIVVRTLVRVYEDQCAWVCWGKAKSSRFSIVNGTRQGSVLSPALFAVYVDDLLKELRNLGVGCHVGGVYMGAAGFCDDLLLIAPNRCAMVLMLAKCEEFARTNNLIFSTDPVPSKSKTKCMFMCGKDKNMKKPKPLVLNGEELPWVETASHLGHELHVDGTFDFDARSKKFSLIEKTTQVRETFNFAHPLEVIHAMKVYCCDHYGYMLWDL